MLICPMLIVLEPQLKLNPKRAELMDGFWVICVFGSLRKRFFHLSTCSQSVSIATHVSSGAAEMYVPMCSSVLC